MAYLFDDASSQYIENLSAIVTGAPFSISCWFNSDDITQVQTLVDIGDKDLSSDVQHHALLIVSSQVWALSQNVTNAQAVDTGAAMSSNVWYHAAGVWTNNESRAAFRDGGNKGTEGTLKLPSGLDCTRFGKRANAVNTQYLSGKLAEVGIWDVALTDAEIAILGRGYSPYTVCPQSLVFYLPLVRGISDMSESLRTLTAYNTPTVSAHPRVLYPARVHSVDLSAGTAAAARRAMMHYKRLRT